MKKQKEYNPILQAGAACFLSIFIAIVAGLCSVQTMGTAWTWGVHGGVIVGVFCGALVTILMRTRKRS